jgi:hypothetical protein
MGATPASTFTNSEQRIADLQRQLVECRAELDNLPWLPSRCYRLCRIRCADRFARDVGGRGWCIFGGSSSQSEAAGTARLASVRFPSRRKNQRLYR